MLLLMGTERKSLRSVIKRFVNRILNKNIPGINILQPNSFQKKNILVFMAERRSVNMFSCDQWVQGQTTVIQWLGKGCYCYLNLNSHLCIFH